MSEKRLDDILRRYLQQHLTISSANLNRAKNEIVPLVEKIMKMVESKDSRFKMRLEHRGSVYEKVKIKGANEFDFDLVIIPLTVDECSKGRMADIPSEYTTFAIKSELQESWKNLASRDNKLLSAERLVAKFASLIKQSIEEINKTKDSSFPFELDITTNHPAVTVGFKQGGKTVYDVDLAPVIEVKKWPENLTKGWENRRRKGWPSPEMIASLKEKTSVYLVPKLYRDKTHEMRNYLWRYAFNRGEKRLLLETDGGASNSCRRNVLRILKGLLEDLKWQGLRSYHMKTVLLYESETWPGAEEWKDAQMRERVLCAVRRLRSFVDGNRPKCKHYFLPDINILESLNEQQKCVLLKKLNEFLDNPLAGVLSIVLDRVTESVEATSVNNSDGSAANNRDTK
eukprot:gene18077-19886_t